jgi:hypothetical protein
VNNLLYAIGGLSSTTGGCDDNLEAYDPSTGQWTELAPYPFPGYGMAAVAINNVIYVFGGANCADNGNSSAAVYAYNPIANSWTSVSSLPSGGLAFMSGATDGTSAYLVGGSNAASGAFSGTIQIYNPSTNSWTVNSAFPATQGAGVVWDSSVASPDLVIFGGECCGGGVQLPDNPYTEYLYFPSSNQIVAESNTNFGVAYSAIDIDDGNILVVNGGNVPTLHCFFTCTGPLGSPTLASPNVARIDFAGAFINGTFYVVGGFLWNGSAYNVGTGALEAYQP